MSILDGFRRKKKYLKTPDGYKLESYWTSSESVEFSDGKTAEEKLSGINGITDSLSDDSSDVCLSSAAGNNLQKQVTTINSSLLTNSFKDAPATMSATAFADSLPINYIGYYVFHGYSHNDVVNLPIAGNAYGYIYRISEAYSLITIHYLYSTGLKTYTRIKVNEWQDWVMI